MGQDFSFIVGGMQNAATTLEDSWWPLLTKLNIALPYDQQLVLGGVYPNESKSQFYMRIYTRMFTTVLFVPKAGCNQDVLL